MEILRQVIPNIAKPLTYICNKSFIEGCFPDSMRISRIVHIFKARDKNTLNIYGPISMLPQFSKVLEELFENRLLNLVEKNNVLNDDQYDLWRNRSTAIALIDLSQKVSTFLDNKLSALGIFLDLRRASNTIDHGILVKSVENMGVWGIALEWVASYIANRKQYVSFLSEHSSYTEVVCGMSHKAQYMVHYYLCSTLMMSVIFQTIFRLPCLQMAQLYLVHTIILTYCLVRQILNWQNWTIGFILRSYL